MLAFDYDHPKPPNRFSPIVINTRVYVIILLVLIWCECNWTFDVHGSFGTHMMSCFLHLSYYNDHIPVMLVCTWKYGIHLSKVMFI